MLWASSNVVPNRAGLFSCPHAVTGVEVSKSDPAERQGASLDMDRRLDSLSGVVCAVLPARSALPPGLPADYASVLAHYASALAGSHGKSLSLLCSGAVDTRGSRGR